MRFGAVFPWTTSDRAGLAASGSLRRPRRAARRRGRGCAAKPGGPAARLVRLQLRKRLHQVGLADTAQDAGHHDVGHRELRAGDPLAVRHAPLDVAEPAAGEPGQLRVELGGGLLPVEHPDHVEAGERRADGADGGEAPLDDTGAALDVARDQLAGLLGQVQNDRSRLGHHEAVVIDDRRLAERADPTVGVAVELAAGVVEGVDAIRQPRLFERPLRPEVLGLAATLGKDASEAIERDHVVVLRRRLDRRSSRSVHTTRADPREGAARRA
jgi:hypothetical protein